MQRKEITTKQAAELLGKSVLSIQWGIRTGAIPIGAYVLRPGKKRGKYVISPAKINQYAGVELINLNEYYRV